MSDATQNGTGSETEGKDERQYFEPSEIDVLLGRGKPTQNHPGNRRFLQIVEVHRENYQKASKREEKKSISDAIVDRIRQDGGHFLDKEPSTGRYFEVSHEKALEKVKHALRNKKAENNDAVEPINSNIAQLLPPVTASNDPNNEFARQGGLLSSQQQFFRQYVTEDEGDEDMMGRDGTQVNQEGIHYMPNFVGSGSQNGNHNDTFDELLRRQQLIFQKLLIDESNSGERMAQAVRGPL